jgi:prepilin-type N-terminal cleavage/methylation domain-containing protein
MAKWAREEIGSQGCARPWRPHAGSGESKGFTLVELLIVMSIIPIIVGALSLGLIMIFSLQHGISNRVSDAGDAQVVSSTFIKDVQSAQMITTENTTSNPASSLACGSGPSGAFQLLGLEWGGNGGNFVNAVSYFTDQNPGLSSYSLFRQFCSGGVTSTATTVATDLSVSGANTPPTISCSSTNTPCTSGDYRTGWIDAGLVQSILLSAQEHALLPQPNSSTPFTLTLSASPRVHLETTTSYSGGGGPPITVLGDQCSTPSFNITNNVTVSINVGGGVGNGTLGLNAKNCPTVEVDPGASLHAGAVFTTDPKLGSVYYKNGGTYPIPEYYATDILNPYTALVAPSTDASTLNPGHCSQSGSTWTCTAGDYTQDPSSLYWGNGANQTIYFQTTGCGSTPDPNSCRFLFEQGLSLPGQSTVYFGTGIYVYEGGTSGTALTANPGVSINAALTGGSQVLFYIASGSASFAPGITINMAGLSEYLGVTIWDDAPSSPLNPLVIGNNSNGGAYAGYGGIYSPNQGVQVTNDQGGTLTVSFIVAQSLTFGQNLTIDITQ